MNKNNLIHKIKSLEGITHDERAYLINLVNTKKKYGLVWEDKPEDVEEQLRENLPVLCEVVERRILASEIIEEEIRTKEIGKEETKTEKPVQGKIFPDKNLASVVIERVDSVVESVGVVVEPVEAPNHILIEGDNLHALTALTFTHEGKIDVIYIDPPYNTGNKDFKYNDRFVDKEDSYRHSKWISFMHKRLVIAKRLLSVKGVIFISIDDNEQAQLRLLCDDVFGQENFIDNIIWEKNYAPKNDTKFFSASHDFILVYHKGNWIRRLFKRTIEQISRYKNIDNDPRGVWQSDNMTVKTYSKSYDYPILTPSGKEVWPSNGRCWFTSKERMVLLINDNRVWFGADGNNTPRLKRFLVETQDGSVPMTIWKKEEVGHNQDAKREIKELLFDTKNPFETPKPTKLIRRILELCDSQITILDYFAGSGTTLNATMQLNAEDGGNRQCILVTNNENNIAEEVCYERNKRVIQGYMNNKGEKVQGLTNNNLRYYRSEFVGRTPNLKNKRELTRLATELLCIKEDCFDVLTLTAFGTLSGLENQIKIFESRQVYLRVFYDDTIIEEAIELIKQLENKEKPVKVYVFSNGQYAYAEEFEEVADRVTICALPDAIYKAYQNVLPKKKREVVPEMEDEIQPNIQTESNLFNQSN